MSVEMFLKIHEVWIALMGIRDDFTKMVRIAELLVRIKDSFIPRMPVGIWNLIYQVVPYFWKTLVSENVSI